jgi:hypothetical protein
MRDRKESLTIRILGDSSHFDAELQKVEKRIENLGRSFAKIAEMGPAFGQLIDRISAARRPLQTLEQLLERIAAKIRALSRIPVRLNVRPALAAIVQLNAALDGVALRLQRFGAVPIAAGAFPVRGFAEGGFVTGPTGLDRVPALLSSGEFVLRRDAVDRLGLQFLNALNHAAPRPSAAPLAPPTPLPATSNTYFGGVTLNVQQPANVNRLLRDLEAQHTRLRNRRG